jgi:IclR family transcriptional regulator, acetate operon repressor
MAMRQKSKDPLRSPTAKVFAVLGAVARQKSASVSAIAEELGLAVPTAYRICIELERLGQLQRAPGTRQWTIARPMVELAASVLGAAAGAAITDAILRNLTREIGEMCSFAVQVGDDVVYAASAEPPHELTLSFRAGRRAPLFCTSSGRLFLSRLDDVELRGYLVAAPLPAYTPFTIVEPERLMSLLRRVRTRGYAVTNHEYVLHVGGAAVPVQEPGGSFYGALSVAAPVMRTDVARLRKLVPRLQEAAGRLVESWSLRAAGTPEARRPSESISKRF